MPDFQGISSEQLSSHDLVQGEELVLEVNEKKKTLLLRNEMIEWYKGCVEIGLEHYLIGLAWGTDSVIV